MGLVSLNGSVYAAGLEVGSYFDTSSPHINTNIREYKGEPSDLIPQKIPPALVGNEIGKVVWFRRVSSSKESLTVLPLLQDLTHGSLFSSTPISG